ncbi:MAG: hypothetical protein N3A72_08945 [bacterium]|nr:hypothetical protein [bacterium]
MNRKKLITNTILIIIILGLLGYYFFYQRNQGGARIARKTVPAKPTSDRIQVPSAGSELSGTNEIRVETSFDGNAVVTKRFYRNIGTRDLFTPLIPPPPPPKPKERGVHELTINWVVEEIISANEAIITDTRRAPHTVSPGDEIGGVTIGRIEPETNRVELIYKNESKWLVLQDIETVTRGWKLEGVSPDTGEAYVFIERYGRSMPLSEGTTFDHIRLEKVRDDGIELKYGTQRRIIKMGGF